MHCATMQSLSIQRQTLTAAFSMPRLDPLLRLPPLCRIAIFRTPRPNANSYHAPCYLRLFTTSSALPAKNLPPRRIIPESEFTEKFLHGSGPGGQKINKTSSAVQLKHLPTGIVVKYQDTRSRSLNRKNARRILQDKLEELEMGEHSRTNVKAREKSKKKASSTKKKRRKYKALEGGKAGEEGEEEEEEDGVEHELEDSAEERPAKIEAKNASEVSVSNSSKS
jgi:hypothetical protein